MQVHRLEIVQNLQYSKNHSTACTYINMYIFYVLLSMQLLYIAFKLCTRVLIQCSHIFVVLRCAPLDLVTRCVTELGWAHACPVTCSKACGGCECGGEPERGRRRERGRRGVVLGNL